MSKKSRSALTYRGARRNLARTLAKSDKRIGWVRAWDTCRGDQHQKGLIKAQKKRAENERSPHPGS
jgi:hypothetical protein